MKRRNFLKTSTLGLGSIAVTGSAISSAADYRYEDRWLKQSKTVTRKQRPNILWISAEDLSPDLGCYGDDYANSPNLDRLASQGCRYDNVYAASPVCGPVRSGIITGMYASTLGSHNMTDRPAFGGYRIVPPPEVKCFTEYLRAEGYHCTNWAKEDYSFKSAFTAWDKDQYWDYHSAPRDKPFFSVINLHETHESRAFCIGKPLTEPKMPGPSYYQPVETDFDKLPKHDPDKVKLPPYHPDTPLVRQSWARHYDNIAWMDDMVGVMLRRLEDEGLAENTIVFFWGDHGRGMPRCKRWAYDGGIRIPLIIRWPGKIKPGSINEDLISTIDLGPTVLSMAGVKVPEYMQGRPFHGDQKAEPREYVFTGYDRAVPYEYPSEHLRGVRDKRYKYIRNFKPQMPYHTCDSEMFQPVLRELIRLDREGKLKGAEKLYMQKSKPEEELYDIPNDPHEINNLADGPEYQDVLKKMRGVLDDWIEETGDLGSVPEAELKERFWPGGKQPVTADPELKLSKDSEGRVMVVLRCPTEGASIAYKYGEKDCWHLYTEPLVYPNQSFANGRAIRKLKFKADRNGHKESRTMSGFDLVQKLLNKKGNA